MRRRLLLVRADAGAGIGNGHVVRSTALAEEWVRQGGTAVLAATSITEDLRARVEARGVAVRSIEAGSEGLRRLGADLEPSWVAIDGYRFGPDFHDAARPARVLVVDDHGTVGRYVADVILDQNLGATTRPYEVAGHGPRLLVGSRYVLLRSDFLRYRPDGPRDAGAVRNLLVSLGGAPPDALLAQVSRALDVAGYAGRRVILGAGAPVDDIAALFADIDLAVTASGSIVWELSYLGVPMIVFPIAENQRPLAEALAAAGAAVATDPKMSVAALAASIAELVDDGPRRAALSERSRGIVDGLGARRVVAVLRGIELALRSATANDAGLLFRWANDAEVRRMSFRSDPIGWDGHLRWLEARLVDPDTELVIVGDDRGDVGQFRAEREDGDATVGVSLDASRRGEHLAPAVIERCSTELLERGWAERLHAWIRPGNEGSRRAFTIAGYEEVGSGEVEGVPAVHYARG